MMVINRSKNPLLSWKCRVEGKHEECNGILYEGRYGVKHCECNCHDPNRKGLDEFT